MSENYTPAKILDEEMSLKDGLENLMANLGTDVDKRSATRFTNGKKLSHAGNKEELNGLYREDWLAGKIVDIIPDDMTREWRTFDGELDPKLVEMLVEEENRLKLRTAVNSAHKWSRLYGTSLIVMAIDDGQTADQPLNIDNIKEGGLMHITPLDRHRVNHADQVISTNPLDKNFGMPESYRFVDSSAIIHHSRVLRFDAITLPYDQFRENNYFSDSVLGRLYDALMNMNIVSNSAASMVFETNVDIVKVKNLMSHLQTKAGETNLRKRFALANTLKSFNNMMLLDTDETFDSKTSNFASLPDLLDRYALFLSAASDIPATRLLGSSASGLNATGEGDLKNYYDTIRSAQVQEYKPRLDYFDRIMTKSLGISDAEDITYEFNSLFQMTPKEQADLEYTRAQRDEIYLTNSVIDEITVAKDLKQNDTYLNITDEFIKELEEIIEEEGDDDLEGDTTESEEGTSEEAKGGEEENDPADKKS